MRPHGRSAENRRDVHNRWRILVVVDAQKIDEMVRQSPDRAYDIAFFINSPARQGGPSASLSEDPNFRPPN